MIVWERKLRDKVSIDGIQFGFIPRKGATDGIFKVWKQQEKLPVKKKVLFYAFVDLEMAFNRVPREVIR